MKPVHSELAVAWNTAPQTKDEALTLLRSTPSLYQAYQEIRNPQWKVRLLDFFAGQKSLPLTYDPFFKYIFHPDRHADRLENFISSILGMQVKIRSILPVEDSLIDGETYLIMDLLVVF